MGFDLNKIGCILKRIRFFWNRCVTLTPVHTKGYVLLSYICEPFLGSTEQTIRYSSHTNHWECWQIAHTFLNLGYEVDIINWGNSSFVPKKKYLIVIDIHKNLERLAPFLPQNCIKILHVTGAHWLFQNNAEYSRLLALQKRRGITLKPRRIAPPSAGVEHADYITILGNDFTISTFNYARKPIYRIPISTVAIYPFFEDKNYEACHRNFLWLGSSGLVHKGLDLVLEAFAQMPEYRLTICGCIEDEKDFQAAFYKELYQTSNIQTLGWVDVKSEQFVELVKAHVGVVYPSCSEGGGGSVIACLHAGLIPILTYESSVDVMDFGLILPDASIDSIKNSIFSIATLTPTELREKSKKAWNFARTNHTRDSFSTAYQDFATNILDLDRGN